MLELPGIQGAIILSTKGSHAGNCTAMKIKQNITMLNAAPQAMAG
jgi:hypothetical protein